MKGSTKPLKGQTISSSYGYFDTINASALKLESLNIAGVFEDGILLNVIIKDSQFINSVIGAEGAPNVGYFTDLTTYNDVTFLSYVSADYVAWDPVTGVFTISNELNVNGCSKLGNIEICNNDIKATNLNGDITIQPNGQGTINLTGPIFNVATTGNFYTNIGNGSITFQAKEDIVHFTSKGSLSLSSFDTQTLSTQNGDIVLSVGSSTEKDIALARPTVGSTLITTTAHHMLKVGDVISVEGTGVSGPFDTNVTVSSILTDTTFSVITPVPLSTNVTIGTINQINQGRIVLDTQSMVYMPLNTPLVMGTTCNSVYGNTSGIILESCNDIVFDIPGSKIVSIPEATKLQFGSGAYVNQSAGAFNVVTNDDIVLDSTTTYINSDNTRITDPIVTIADYTLSTTDNKDRGIEFRYLSTSGSMKLGWFGYKASTDKFTFIPDAINNNEVISGTPGKFEISDIEASTINVAAGGIINMNCGTLLNVSRISACGSTGVLNVDAGNRINVSAASTIALQAGSQVFVPENVSLTFGTRGSLVRASTSGNVQLVGSNNLELTTQNNGSVILPVSTSLNFDGTSSGSQRIVSNGQGDLTINASRNIFLSTTSGNIVVPQGTPLQFGTTSNTIVGNTGGLVIQSTQGLIQVVANTGLTLGTQNGDVLVSATNGNLRLLDRMRLVLGVSGTGNSLVVNSTGQLLLSGSGTNTFGIQGVGAINLDAQSIVRIPVGVPLVFSQTNTAPFVVSGTDGSFSVSNTSGTIRISGSSGSFLFPSLTSMSTESLVVSGSSTSSTLIYTENTRFRDPILTIGDYTASINDNKDRGVEFLYSTTSGSSKLGWFGWKNSSGRFTYFSDAINTGEVISGTVGQVELGSAFIANSLNFINSGQIDLNCGTIANVNTITGCGGIMNLVATNNLVASAGNIRLATSSVLIPHAAPIVFGSISSSLRGETNGNIVLTANGGQGTFVINGDVLVNGTTHNVYSTVTNIEDPIVSIGGVIGPIINDGKDRGIEFKWSPTSGSTKVGFFGYKNSLQRFVFIQDGTNTNEVFSGSFGNVQFGNTFVNNVDVNNGTISNIRLISGGQMTIVSTSGPLALSSGSVALNTGSLLTFGDTRTSIASDSNGSLFINSQSNTTIASATGGIILATNTGGGSFVQVSQNTPLVFGTGGSNFIIRDTTGNLTIASSTGSVNLTPQYSSGSVLIPTNTFLGFGSTSNSIISDGQQLLINGYSGVGINTSTLTISGSVNIIGTISASNTDFDLNSYILPLGTNQIVSIVSIIANVSGPGNVTITTGIPAFFSVGDSITLKNTNSIPTVDGTYTVQNVISPSVFTITKSGGISTPGNTGTVRSNLMTIQDKDVGIQVNYWKDLIGNGLTSGNTNYNTGFFGWKNSLNRWAFYNQATIANNIVSGTLGDIEVNKVFATRMSGFTLDGNVSAGANAITGTNFQINGGTINNTPIGASTAQSGRFSQLSNTVSASLSNVTLASSLAYTFERYTLSSAGLQTRNPSINFVCSLFSVSGPAYTTSSGTMPSSSATVPDGTLKILVCSSMGTGSQHTVHFGTNKLITPNPPTQTAQASRIVFKRQGQSCTLVFDATANAGTGAWIVISGTGVYIG
jgi:hypothetical protein